MKAVGERGSRLMVINVEDEVLFHLLFPYCYSSRRLLIRVGRPFLFRYSK